MENKTANISVIIADDHTILAEGIATILKSNNQFSVIRTAVNGEKTLSLLSKEHADIIIMDINMPVLDGINATEIIKERFPKTKVLIMSTYNKGGYIHNSLEAGASGYILKNVDPTEMIAAIKLIMAGGTYFSQDVARTMATRIISNPKNEDVIKLSRQEKQLLKLLSEGNSNDEISVIMKSSVHTIRSCRRLMMSKFNAKNNAQLVFIARDKGYIS